MRDYASPHGNETHTLEMTLRQRTMEMNEAEFNEAIDRMWA